MRRLAFVLPLLAILILPWSLRAEPEKDLAEKMRQVEELMRLLDEADQARKGVEFAFEEENPTFLRVYNVADLTVRLDNFTAPNLELKPAGAEIDEARPLFGAAREGEIFFAGPEELMDLITANVQPEIWDYEHVGIWCSGPYGLVVVGREDLHADVARYLDGLRRSVGRLVTVEVRVLHSRDGLDLPAVLTPAEGEALLRRAETEGPLKLVHSARLNGFNGQRVSLFRGAQHSFVQDYDVEVAQTSSISDPIVNILQTGLSFDVRPISRGDDLVILDLRAQLSSAEDPFRKVATGSGPVQAPDQTLVRFSTTATVPAGSYAVVGSGSGRTPGRWALLVRARTDRMAAAETGGAK